MRRADLRAARANRVFRADEKRIRTENTVIVNTKSGVGFRPRSLIARGCAFHPRAINDPRGRGAVRASAGGAARSILQRRPMPPLAGGRLPLLLQIGEQFAEFAPGPGLDLVGVFSAPVVE